MENIRNFCIIAHIDHGKSTLADRFLEYTGTISKRDMREQLLDTMDIERERGITIKLQPVRMNFSYSNQNSDLKNSAYQLNLIDTPGHVDFSYEVSRSLAAVEGAILLVDASQGIEAQTLANLYMAMEHNLTIIPVVNKIDLPHAEPEKVAHEICELLGCTRDDVILASGKTGQGVEEILRAVVEKVPSPKGNPEKPLRALIFDSIYDPYRGVIAYVRVVDGEVKAGDKLAMLQVKSHTLAEEVGMFNPKHYPQKSLQCGEIGYIVTGFKDVASARVGDTISAINTLDVLALPGYRQITPLVYAGLYTVDGDQYPTLREALGKLKLNDASLQYDPETSAAFGFGFRCGFLGLLHMEIIKERLEREAHVDLIATTPSVPYQVELMRSLTKNEIEQQVLMGIVVDEQNPFLSIHSPAQLPEPSSVKSIKEPWAIVEIVVPKNYIGPVMEMAQLHRGLYQNLGFLDEDRSILKYELPISELIIDFYDQLKSVTSGYGSLNYEFLEYRGGDLVKLSILVAGDEVDSLSAIVHRTHALTRGRALLSKLKTMIPRQLFEIMLQAAVGGKIIAREDIPAVGKNVTAKLYGGDVTRKNKLLDKQKEGKKRLKRVGKVDIPTEVFLNLLKN
jgi:GTP-binding protein LepA